MASDSAVADSGWLRPMETAEGPGLSVGGRWDIANAGRLDAELNRLPSFAAARVRLDIGELALLDTAGAWLLHRSIVSWREAGAEVDLTGAHPDHAAMLKQVADNYKPCDIAPPRINAIVRLLTRIGRSTVEVLEEAGSLMAFLGEGILAFGRTLANPRRLRLTSTVFHMEQVGLNAVPIVALISFLIGVVLAYQGAQQLQRFGAEVFVVNLIAVSILREIGILLTAIVIAGRSGSAFTAQIGAMKVNEEIDAMRTLGLDPMEVLVVPRMLALMITLPLLAFVADIMGLLGGGLMAWVALGIGPGLFLERLNEAVGLWSFWVGIIKAPVFAFLIALIGCYEGMKVTGSAESVGRQTTVAVVEAIFLVIVFDAIFSIFFSILGI
ncbi:MAG: MlaE family lipid ABC transporter permease subunit [Minwuiales bacterium]|nr:MlaE family lipid ABC transporter permease subunit [Minwuiales bacterium]